ncbi:hypothetical protein [Microbacterium sp. NPDC055683]
MKLPQRRRPYSERVGLVSPPQFARQFRELSHETRIALWNVIYSEYTDLQRGWTRTLAEDAARTLHVERYAGAVDEQRHDYERKVLTQLKSDIVDGDAITALEALEDAYHALHGARDPIGNAPPTWSSEAVNPITGADFIQGLEQRINEVLARFYVDHRMRGGYVTDIGQGFEADTVDDAISEGPFEVARQHLAAALHSLTDETESNKLDSAREAIHAVESAARVATGERTLGKALKHLQRTDSVLYHPALVDGWDKIYGWTSDAGGLRHGDEVLTNVPYKLARWLVVSAAAFLTYLEADGSASDREKSSA